MSALAIKHSGAEDGTRVRLSTSARLRLHEVWLKSDGTLGEPAKFQNEDISHVKTLFRHRDLRKIVFVDVDLDETAFVDSDLTGVDLSSARNLNPDQFAGAVLRNTKLPNDVDFSSSLNSVAEITKLMGKILTSLLVACIYSWLTIASTKDAELLANRTTSSLPLIEVTIPIVSFYQAAPIVLLGLFIYFCLQLNHLWEEMAVLPAVFPDGIPLYRKVSPSPWSSFVSIAFYHLAIRHRSRIQIWAGAVVTWGIVPINLLHIWVKYLRCHESEYTALQIVCILVSAAFGMWAVQTCFERLKTHESVRRPAQFMVPVAILAIVLFVALLLLTLGSFQGGPADIYNNNQFDHRAANIRPAWSHVDYRFWAPLFLCWLPGCAPFADLEDAELSTGANDPAHVHGAQLNKRNLRFMNGTRAIMVGSSLIHADLYGVNFWNGDLRYCNLSYAHAENSILYQADLQGALLVSTTLTDANLSYAQLQNADLTDAVLTNVKLDNSLCVHTNFTKTDLRNASFINANVELAAFNGAVFDPTAVKQAHNWILARYWDTKDSKGTTTLTTRMGLPPNHNARISNRDLTHYDLRNKDLTGADLNGFKLGSALLDGANLSKAILTKTTGLTVKQLATANVDYMTKLPPNITMEQIEKVKKLAKGKSR